MSQTSVVTFHHPQPARLLAFWRDDLTAYEMEVQTAKHGVLNAQAGPLRLTMQAQQQGCRIEIACEDPALLPEYRTWLSQRMLAFDPDMAVLSWSGAAAAGALPPTLAIGQVTACVPLGRSWWRMTVALSSEGYHRFSSDAHWHFRLLRAATPDRTPVWPRLDENGVIGWPEGADKLTDRVFTVRACDGQAQAITFDIFRHPGGPTSDWAGTLPMGQTVGLMGPGAKAGPTVSQPGAALVVGGDETSAPAILRAVATLPKDSPATITLLVGSARDVVPEAGTQITWLFRDAGATEETLLAATRRCLDRATPETRLWFAASKAAARDIKTHALERGLPKRNVHAVSFWS